MIRCATVLAMALLLVLPASGATHARRGRKKRSKTPEQYVYLDGVKERVFWNDGKGRFTKTSLPVNLSAGSCVVAGDYDGDGDDDLFVGGRGLPGKYPYASTSFILQNNKGKFTDVTSEIASALSGVGMVTSALWTDYDHDGKLDLIVVGEWMPITVFKNQGGKFVKQNPSGLASSHGWWNKIVAHDFDQDGDMDYVAGNFGENSKFKVSVKEPLHVYCGDFDESGTLDIVLGYYNQGLCYPVRGRQCTSEQMPYIKKKFPTYDAFGRASLVDVYGYALNNALHYKAYTFASSYIENTGDGNFIVHPLPVQAQFSTVFGIITADFTGDGHTDLLLAGNFYPLEVETGRNDAGKGLLLSGDGKGKFTPITLTESGFYDPGDVRAISMIEKKNGQKLIIVANNKDKLQSFNVSAKPSL